MPVRGRFPVPGLSPGGGARALRAGRRSRALDFSACAIGTARELARDTGMADRSRFVVSDVYEAPAALGGELFDIVYTGFGSLVWLPDLTRWARTAASLLKDQGVLYLAEFHPLTELLGEDGRSVAIWPTHRGRAALSSATLRRDAWERKASRRTARRNTQPSIVRSRRPRRPLTTIER